MKKGVWIDLHQALIIPENGTKIVRVNGIETRVREEGEGNDQGRMGDQFIDPEKKRQEKRHHQLDDFLDLVMARLDGCEVVLIFGPASVKEELEEAMAADYRFNETMVYVETADSMTDNQAMAYVRDFFADLDD